MLARLSAFVIWSLVAATAMFWALRLGVRAAPAPAYAVPVERSVPAHGDMARLFGSAPVLAAARQARPEAASRFRLLGVMAPKTRSPEVSRYGFALIAIDGKPAKAFSVGSHLESDLVLQSVGLRTASLGPAQGGQSVLLELPRLPAPATGVLPLPGQSNSIATIARPVPRPVVGAAPVPPPARAAVAPPEAEPEAAALPVNPSLPAADEARSQ